MRNDNGMIELFNLADRIYRKRLDTEEKIQLHRTYREKQYELLTDAVYKQRGWTQNGCPTLATLKEIGLDLPEVVEVVKKHQ